MSVEQIASRLRDRFHRLADDSGSAIPRRHTLRTAIEWSYDLLNKQEQTVLLRVSTLEDDWTLDAAVNACEGGAVTRSQVTASLSSLVEKSLATYEEVRGKRCFRLAKTVRQFGHEKLAERGAVDRNRVDV